MAYGYGFGRKYLPKIEDAINKMSVMNKIIVIGTILSIMFNSLVLSLIVFMGWCLNKAYEHMALIKYKQFDVFSSIGRTLKSTEDKAESPIEVLITIMVFLILMTGVVFAEGAFIDGFLATLQNVPITLPPRFQTMMMNSPIMFASIFFSLPTFFGAVLIVWGVKSIIRKHGYTRAGREYLYEEF